MLNPSTDKYTIEFGGDFYPKEIVKKYDEFLFHKNHPIKNIQGHISESIQTVTIPGMALNTLTVQGLNNVGSGGYNQPSPTTVNVNYPGNSPMNEIFEGTALNITLRNTIINWMYFYEFFRGFYNRTNKIDGFTHFNLQIIVRDAAEIPMISFSFNDCFISNLPGLEFSFNTSFRESKTFDIGITFNKFDVGFLIPNFVKSNRLVKA